MRTDWGDLPIMRLLYVLRAKSQSQSSVTTDGQSVGPSWCRAPSGAHDQMLRTVRQLLFCPSGALSDERSGLSFVIAFGSLLSIVNRWYTRIYN
jgi:hypothetical protein